MRGRAGGLPGAQVLVLSAGDTTSVATPEAPLLVANDGSVSCHFKPAANALSYTATLSNGASVSGTVSPLVVPAPNGVLTTCTLTAVGIRGSATSAPSNAVTPTPRPAALSGILGMMAWWDASQLPVVANGTAVATWPDASGNGYTATPSGNPLYRTAGNWGLGGTGRPAVGFDGVTATAQRFTTTLNGLLTGPEITLFAVFDKAATNNQAGQPDQRVFSQESTKNDRGFALMLSNSPWNGGGDIITVRSGTGEINQGGAITLGQPYIVSVVTGAQMFVQGARQAPHGFAITGPSPRPTPFTIGHIFGGNGGANNAAAVGQLGRDAELIVFRGRISDAQRWAVEGYLGTKYGVAMTQAATL